MPTPSKYCSVSHRKSSTARASLFPTKGEGFGISTTLGAWFVTVPPLVTARLQRAQSLRTSSNCWDNDASRASTCSRSKAISPMIISRNSRMHLCTSPLTTLMALFMSSRRSLKLVSKLSRRVSVSTNCTFESLNEVSTSINLSSNLAMTSLDFPRRFLPPAVRDSSRPRISSSTTTLSLTFAIPALNPISILCPYKVISFDHTLSLQSDCVGRTLSLQSDGFGNTLPLQSDGFGNTLPLQSDGSDTTCHGLAPSSLFRAALRTPSKSAFPITTND